MANTNPLVPAWCFVTWLRRAFDVDESRLRVVLYLHEGLDLDAADRVLERAARRPVAQFRKPYRAVADPTIRDDPSTCYGCADGALLLHA